MQFKPLYRVEFFYTDEWGVNIKGPTGTESQHFFRGEGNRSGILTGRFRGAKHPRRHTDHTYLPDFQGVILTDDGASVYFDYQGYRRAYPSGVSKSSAPYFHVSRRSGNPRIFAVRSCRAQVG